MDIGEYDLPEFESVWDAMHKAVDFAKDLHEKGEKILVVSGGPSHPATSEVATLLRSVGIKTLVVGYCEVMEFDNT